MAFPLDLTSGMIPAKTTPNQSVYTDLLDSSGKKQTARLIDPNTQDYVLNSNGYFVGMDEVNQSVQLALLTSFQSASTPIGNTLSSIRLVTPNIQNIVQNVVQRALANLLNANKITLGKVSIVIKGSNMFLTVPFTNLVSGQQQSHEIKIR
jgi:hypothetical protein